MTFDPAAAAQAAFFAALDVPEVTGLAPVFQHVPEDTQPPIVIIGNIGLEPIGGKDGGFDRVSIDIITFVRQPDQAALFALQAAVRDRLDGRPVSSSGAILSSPVQTASDSQLMEDGETYMGTQRYETLVQPS